MTLVTVVISMIIGMMRVITVILIGLIMSTMVPKPIMVGNGRVNIGSPTLSMTEYAKVETMDCRPSSNMNLSVITYNCYRLKSSLPYVIDLASEHDVLFINEHWLQESDLPIVTDILKDHDLWSNLQSSVDPTKYISGRPFGGIGFLCRSKDDRAYKPVPCESDRISCLQVMVEHEVVTNIIGVYMPYNDSTSETMEHYLELLDLVQSLMDNFSNAAPTIIVGDFNAALPDSEYLKEKWFCNKPYSKQSAVLYDFLASNEMCIANFLFDQEVDYTFRRQEVKSYIDHIMIPLYLYDTD